MTKVAAEVMCADLPKLFPRVRVLTHRLPTDQTSSGVHGVSVDPVEVLLPIIREMHQ